MCASAPASPARMDASERCVAPSARNSSASRSQSSGVPSAMLRRQSIPIWIGGSAEAAIRRAARLADGFFPQRPLEGGWPTTMERFRAWVTEAGRDPSHVGIEWRLSVAEGTPDDWLREAEEWRALGATHLSVASMRGGLAGADAHIERIREAAEALLS